MPVFPENAFCRKRRPMAVCLLLFFSFICALLWPLDTLEITISSPGNPEDGKVLLRKEVLPGRDIINSIIHSVQLTPVIDVYRIQEGKIWAWREMIQSHNAGLPSLRPKRGRFLYDAPWMIVEGGGASWERIHYRVGTEDLGKNILCVFAEPCMELWREVPGKRLMLRVAPPPCVFLL